MGRRRREAAGPDRNVVGVELSCSHLRSVRDGHLTAVAVPIRVGRTIQVWHISLTDDEGRVICDARCSVAVLGEPGGATGAVRPHTGGEAPLQR